MSKYLQYTTLGFLSVLLLAAAAIIPASPSEAGHKEVRIPADYNRQQCSGSHCLFVATWAAIVDRDIHLLEAMLTMDVLALEFGITNQNNEVTTQCEPGDTLTVPIDGGGEIVGHAGRFYDSPPIFFESGGALRAETTGLTGCGFPSDIVVVDMKCESISLANRDVLGTWQDSWQAYTSANTPTSDITCTSNSAGTEATCQVGDNATGINRLELTRTVDNLRWHVNGNSNPGVPVFGTVWVEDVNGNPINPFPGSLTSSVTVNCGADVTPTPTPTGPPQCSDGIDNDNDGNVDCDDLGCWTDQRDPNTCDPDDDSESDTPVVDPPIFRETE